MLTNINEINQHILSFLDSSDIINYLFADNVIAALPINNLFIVQEQYENDIRLTSKLLQLNHIKLVKDIIIVMYKSKELDKLLMQLFLSDDFELLLLFLTSTPDHFNWGDLDSAFLGYPFKIRDRDKDKVIENLTTVSRALIQSKNITIIKQWTNHIFAAMLRYDYLRTALGAYHEICRILLSLHKLRDYYDDGELNELVLNLLK